MSGKTVDEVVRVLRGNDIPTLDVTGGAPELNPHFGGLVMQAREMNRHVIVRSNLTVFFEKGMDGLFDFYDLHDVEIIASLPSYSEGTADRMRGSRSFDKSISALRKLNALGYGMAGTGKVLNLVYNPQGAFLPPCQETLEQDYRMALSGNFGVFFNRLYVLANMPIGRFRDFLVRSGNLERYMKKIEDAFNPESLQGIMCRRMINVRWDGTLYDCDFNQMIGLPLREGYPRNIRHFDFNALAAREPAMGDHCYGCTAGQGST
jgi:radical SAM/Cys-rich protein